MTNSAAQNPHQPTLPPTGTGRVAERVVDEIRAYVDAKGLMIGDKLPPERVFMELFGVGRSSLREALRVLSTVGIIDVRHGDGMYVAGPADARTASPKAIFDATEQNALRNLVETRLGIELAAVTAATLRATDDDFVALQRMLDEQEQLLARDPDFTWEPLGFELAVVEISGNTWLYEVELMLREAWLSLSSGLRATVGRHEEWLTEHRAIVASMRSRNVTQAQRLVMAHLSLERFEEDLKSPATGSKSKSRRGTGR
ncbi:FadR/GntR family transcriptional regulator [Actinophytocola sp.]|uniref:FadR/GntR family transcriptional regulator n=1 Tax=Actinophytocola sp. TaxID=1872138 RepID=UPI003D6C30D9